MISQPLTKKQKDILDFVKKFVATEGYAPSYAEIAEHFELSSKASVAQYISTLQEKGYLTKDGTARGVAMTEETPKRTAFELPLLGLIAAGTPIEALEGRETMTIPEELVRDPSLSYVLKVMGTSMIEDGILPGDFVVVEKNEKPNNGDTVVALLENTYATLKRFYKEPGRIRLQPANSTMQPIYTNDVTVQGIVRAIIRKYT
ncbi:MAG: transcriptional repressor LexA [bacterium]